MSELKDGERYFLRGVARDGTAYGGFQWPLQVGAVVTAPDWDPTPKCGGGLHGNLDGGGEATLLVDDGIGMVVAAKGAVDLDGKHKFRKCRILYVGETLRDAATWLASRVASPVHYATATAGDRGTATAGYYGTATAGDRGTATAGVYGTARTGKGGSVIVRHSDGTLRVRPGDGRAWKLTYAGEWEVVP